MPLSMHKAPSPGPPETLAPGLASRQRRRPEGRALKAPAIVAKPGAAQPPLEHSYRDKEIVRIRCPCPGTRRPALAHREGLRTAAADRAGVVRADRAGHRRARTG